MHLKTLNKIFLIDNRIHYDQLMVTTKLPKKIAKLQQHFFNKKSNIQALLVMCGLIETIVPIHARSIADKLNGLHWIASSLGQKDGSSLCSLSSCVHHVVYFLLWSSCFVPHLSVTEGTGIPLIWTRTQTLTLISLNLVRALAILKTTNLMLWCFSFVLLWVAWSCLRRGLC